MATLMITSELNRRVVKGKAAVNNKMVKIIIKISIALIWARAQLADYFVITTLNNPFLKLPGNALL
jgi:hypothetical protein